MLFLNPSLYQQAAQLFSLFHFRQIHPSVFQPSLPFSQEISPLFNY